MMERARRGYDVRAAAAHLRRQDPALARWLDAVPAVGPCPGWSGPFDPVDALARAILYQQLSGKAAATIESRVQAAIGSDRFHCDTLARVDDATLRGCGVSGNKVLALRDLSRREEEGAIPDIRRMQGMDDEAIIAALVPTRGIGRWTVEMMLMFRLGRSDVLPVDDLGVRKGMQAVDGLHAPPAPRAAAARGAIWAPFRTHAALYLWRIAALATPGPQPRRSQDRPARAATRTDD